MISREERKSNLIEYLDDVVGARDYYLDTEDRKMIIEALSQPERPKGRWTNHTGILICSECGAGVNGSKSINHFCPNCGADMRGEEE